MATNSLQIISQEFRYKQKLTDKVDLRAASVTRGSFVR